MSPLGSSFSVWHQDLIEFCEWMQGGLDVLWRIPQTLNLSRPLHVEQCCL